MSRYNVTTVYIILRSIYVYKLLQTNFSNRLHSILQPMLMNEIIVLI